MPVYRLGELFSGPGGLALGAKLAHVEKAGIQYSIQHVWANDYDEWACETYRHNICPENREQVRYGDVRKLDITSLEEIDGFAYGFPCNDFSLVGEQRGINGDFGPLYRSGVKVLNHFKPVWFVAENVGGLQSADGGRTFKLILDDLRKAGNGYRLTTHLYKFEDFGVPQTRHRIIIVGINSSLGLDYKVPSPTHIGRHVPVREALENPPIPEETPNQEITKQSQRVVERLNYIKPGENAWTADLPVELRLNVKNAKLSQIYKRLDPNKPSYTITGSGGGGTHGYHWKEPRALTNRERARIQTFPDNYEFIGPKESVRRQIGMAVPPMGAKVIFEALLKTLTGIKYDYIEPHWEEEEPEEQGDKQEEEIIQPRLF